MGSNSEQARQGAQTKKEQYGDDYFSKIGAKGGASHHKGGFASQKIGKDGLTGPQRAAKVSKKEKGN